MKNKNVLTVKEAESKYKIGRNILYELFADGIIEGYRPGKKKILLYEQSIEQYIFNQNPKNIQTF